MTAAASAASSDGATSSGGGPDRAPGPAVPPGTAGPRPPPPGPSPAGPAPRRSRAGAELVTLDEEVGDDRRRERGLLRRVDVVGVGPGPRARLGSGRSLLRQQLGE